MPRVRAQTDVNGCLSNGIQWSGNMKGFSLKTKCMPDKNMQLVTNLLAYF